MAVLADKVRFYYKCDESSGDLLASVGGVDLTASNAPGTTTGKVGTARSFVRASSQTFFASDQALFDITGVVTFAFWAKLTTNTEQQNLFAKWRNGGNQRGFLFDFDVATQRFRFLVSNDGSAVVSVAADNFGAPSTGVFYFIVGKYDGVNISISVNLGTPNTTAHATGIFNNTANFRVGHNDNALDANPNYFNGVLDEIGAYNADLSAGELTYLYNAGNGRTTPFTVVNNVSTIIPAGGGDYTSLSAWEAAEQRNLEAFQETETALCFAGNLASTGCVVSGWTVTSDLFISIIADDTARHEGIYTKTGVAHIDTGGSNNAGLQIEQNFTFIDGLVFDANNGNNPHILAANATDILADRCIFHGTRAAHARASSAATLKVINSISQNQGAGGNNMSADSGGDLEVYNCTVLSENTANCFDANGAGSTITEQNNYAHPAGTGVVYSEVSGGTISKGANTATSNAEATTVGLRNVPFSVATFESVTGDYNLYPAIGSALIDAGADLSGTEGFTTDIVGSTRGVLSNWEIGAFEFAAPSVPEVDNFQLRTGTWGSRRIHAILTHRSQPANMIGYSGPAIQSRGVDSINPTSKLRRLSQPAVIPSSNYWQTVRARLDSRTARTTARETGFLWHHLLRKEPGLFRVDNLCAVESLIPHSFVHEDEPFATETFTFGALLNLNYFGIELIWMPTFSIQDLTSDLELFRLSVDANNYIKVSLIVGNTLQRDYGPGTVAAHDPILRLEKVRASASRFTIDQILYINHTHSGDWHWSIDDPIVIRIYHRFDEELRFEVDRHGIVANLFDKTDPTAFATATADLIYNGIGWYSQPWLLGNLVGESGRRVPVGRAGIISRTLSPIAKQSILSGERDPSAGKIAAPVIYSTGPADGSPEFVDDFDRPNAGSLGGYWDIISETGAGFGITSNQASVSEAGFASFPAKPGHRDYIVELLVTVSNNSNRAGFLARMDLDHDGATGLGLELRQTGASAANLVLVHWYEGVGYDQDTDALSSYTAGTQYRLRLTLSGNDVLAELLNLADTVLASITTTLTVFKRAGAVGLYGITTGALETVLLDELKVLPNFSSGLT